VKYLTEAGVHYRELRNEGEALPDECERIVYRFHHATQMTTTKIVALPFGSAYLNRGILKLVNYWNSQPETGFQYWVETESP
jgi:hypothetical protein